MKHLSVYERNAIETLFYKLKLSIREIAKTIGRSPSTISRELKRNCYKGYYDFKIAQIKSQKRTLNKWFGSFIKYNDFTLKFLKIFDKKICGIKATMHILKTNFPEIKMVSERQVFNWIKNRNWVLKPRDRLRQYYVKGRKRKIGVFTKVNSSYILPIWMRPKSIDERKEFGHWEIDLIISKKASGHDNLITLTERKTRMGFIIRLHNKNPMKLNSTLHQFIKANKLNIKTLTCDNGIEFEQLGLVAKWNNFVVYKCEPYASYQRGSNENFNGMVRRFYKKGTDFTLISDQELNKTQQQINEMKRKIFNFKSSFELYSLETR